MLGLIYGAVLNYNQTLNYKCPKTHNAITNAYNNYS